MSNWMDCPVNRIIVSFAGGDILTGLDLCEKREINLSDEQKKTIDELRKTYREKHYELSIKLHNKVEEIRSIVRKDSLDDSDRSALHSHVDEHTSILNEIEILWVDAVYEAFQTLHSHQVSTTRAFIDNRMQVFGNSRIIGSI